MRNNKCPNGQIQLYCDKCPFKGNCEAISKGADKQLPFNIKALINKLKKFQSIEKEIKKCKDEIKSFMTATNTNVAKCNDATISLQQNKGDDYTVDLGRLRVEEPDIYAKYRIPAKKYSFLKII